MIKTARADKDAYITNKVIRSKRKTGSNVGDAATLDLFKLYGASLSGSQPNTEISRLLVHFDIDKIKSLYSSGQIDISDDSFWAKLYLRDVFGGQPTPARFNVSVFPLSASFDEGRGRDVSYFSDGDVCNWLSSSHGNPWIQSGCDSGGTATLPCDYITSSTSLPDAEVKAFFETGVEDLAVDVTKILSATITGELPDSGFRITFQESFEQDTKTYFVKRFASRTAYDETRRPSLVVGFDDSTTDDTQNLTFDSPCNLVMYNRTPAGLLDVLSGSSLTPVTGSDCMVLKLITDISGGIYQLSYPVSQATVGSASPVSGTYVASFNVPSTDPVIYAKLQTSSSVSFLPVWSSLDDTVAYLSGSTLSFKAPSRSVSLGVKNYVVNTFGVRDSYGHNEFARVKLNVFDHSDPLVKVVKVPVELPGIVVKEAHYQVRDAVTGDVSIPFDVDKGSTRVSSDAAGMFFDVDMENLIPGRSYVIDVLIRHYGTETIHMKASSIFRVEIPSRIE